jgi:hypothetical protein
MAEEADASPCNQNRRPSTLFSLVSGQERTLMNFITYNRFFHEAATDKFRKFPKYQ